MLAQHDPNTINDCFTQMLDHYDAVFWTSNGGLVAVAAPSVYILETSAHAAISCIHSFYGWTFENINSNDEYYVFVAADPTYVSWFKAKSFPQQFDQSTYKRQLKQRVHTILYTYAMHSQVTKNYMEEWAGRCKQNGLLIQYSDC